jgi:GH25 family lysozyme M1 (1,4-beta-N-acetylmuramidase)
MRARVESLENRRLFARPLGIDVSDHQGDITQSEWNQIKNAGRDFAFTKATEGVTFNATTFVNNITRGKLAGILMGAYHFARPDNNTAVAEADHFIQIITPYLTSGYLRPVLDIETDAGNIAFMSQWVNDFCNRVKNVTGLSPIIYTGQSFASSNFNSSVAQWPLWIAQWPTNPNPETGAPAGTSPWSTWNFWQYSSTGTVPGAGSPIDLDVFNGTLAQLQATYLINPNPEVTVTRGANPITTGQAAAVDFGIVNQGQPGPSLVFTVQNDGGATLTLGAVSVPAGYTLTEPLASSLTAGASDTFTVRLDSAGIGSKSGNISFATNDAGENPFVFPITGLVLPVDVTPPEVNNAAFAYITAPQKLTFTFSENVGASLQPGDLVVRKQPSQATMIVSGVSFDPGTNTATFTLNSPVTTGQYIATLGGAGVFDSSGTPLAEDYVFPFSFLAGDANGDGSVNSDDFNILAANFGQAGMNFSQGDFSYNGVVDSNDFNILASNFGMSAGRSAFSAVRVSPAPARRMLDLLARDQASPADALRDPLA